MIKPSQSQPSSPSSRAQPQHSIVDAPRMTSVHSENGMDGMDGMDSFAQVRGFAPWLRACEGLCAPRTPGGSAVDAAQRGERGAAGSVEGSRAGCWGIAGGTVEGSHFSNLRPRPGEVMLEQGGMRYLG